MGGHFARFGVFDQYRPVDRVYDAAFGELVFDLSHLDFDGRALFVDAAVAVFERRELRCELFFEYGDLRVDIVQLFGVRGVGFQQVFDAPFFALLRGDLLLRGGDLFADVGRAAARRPELFLELQLFQVELDAVDRADGLSGREPPAFFHAERSNSSVGFRGYDHFGRLERPGGVVTVFIAAAGRRPGAKRENQKSFHISCWLYFSGCMSS